MWNAETVGRGHDPDAYDRMRDYSRWQLDEQARWDEAQDEALRAAADRFNEHTEDVP